MPTYQLPAVQMTGPPPQPAGAMLMSLAAPSTTSTGSTGPVRITAQPLEVDLLIYQGDDFYLDVTVTNPDGSTPDLSGADPMAMIRVHPADPDVVAQFDITVDTGGLLHLHLPTDQSSLLPLNSVWDLQLTVPDVITLVAGAVTATREVTR
jgi:hypothetical protein